MIALSLKRHFLMGSLVLRRLPSGLWGAEGQRVGEPFSRSELSLSLSERANWCFEPDAGAGQDTRRVDECFRR